MKFFLYISLYIVSFSLTSKAEILHSPKKVIVSTFDWTGLAIFASGAGLTAYQWQFDERFRNSLRLHNNRVPRVALDIGERFGTGVPNAIIFATQLLCAPQWAWSHLEGTAYSLALVHAIKISVDRERPDGGRHSFPSGHTAMAFVTATNLLYATPWYIGWSSMAIATFVAFERVHDERHWVSDTIAGATLGILFARGSARLLKTNSSFGFQPAPAGGLLTWTTQY